MIDDNKHGEAALEGKFTNPVKRMYDWVLSWADTPYGVYALGAISFAESSFFPVPPDILLIALGLSRPRRAIRYAFICSVFSVVGGILGYGIGYWAYDAVGEAIINAYHGRAVMQKIGEWYSIYGFWGILVAAITPIPYKVFTIASGVFKFDFPAFILASVLGRSIRFFALGFLMLLFGEKVRLFIDRYFNLLAVAFTVLLVGGFFLVKYFSR